MTPPWRRIVIQENHGVMEVHETPQGKRLLPGLDIAASVEDVEEMRQGYRCINCWEPQSEGWPRACFLCGYPIGSRQGEEFARRYKGYDPTLRTGEDWEAAADRLVERAERRAWAKRAKESRIVLGSRSIGEAIKRMKGVAS